MTNRFKVEFTKFFTDGNLKGSSFDDSVSYPTLELCNKWVRNMAAKEFHVASCGYGPSYDILCWKITTND